MMKNMEELYSIMRDFLEVEYKQESLLYLLTDAEFSKENQDDNQDKAEQFVINGAKYYIKALQNDLKATINRLDSYITEKAKKQQ